MKIGIYPGSFDPITIGHLDVIIRGSKLFDELVILISDNLSKDCLFTYKEREKLILDCIKDNGLQNVKVDSCSCLVVEYAKKHNAKFILRGLRAITDYENELQMASTNKLLDPNIETIFLMSSVEHSFISSSIVKEIAYYGGKFENIVPKIVVNRLKDKFDKLQKK